MAILLTMSGIVLLFCGFWIDPQGKVDINPAKRNVALCKNDTCKNIQKRRV